VQYSTNFSKLKECFLNCENIFIAQPAANLKSFAFFSILAFSSSSCAAFRSAYFFWHLMEAKCENVFDYHYLINNQAARSNKSIYPIFYRSTILIFKKILLWGGSRQHLKVRLGAFFWWLSSFYFSMRYSDETTIGKMYSTLQSRRLLSVHESLTKIFSLLILSTDKKLKGSKFLWIQVHGWIHYRLYCQRIENYQLSIHNI